MWTSITTSWGDEQGFWEDTSDLQSWFCYKSMNNNDPDLVLAVKKSTIIRNKVGIGWVGFVSSDIHTATVYAIRGLSRLWLWDGDDKNEQFKSWIVLQDGTARYFDFHDVEKGESVQASLIWFNCEMDLQN